MKVRFTPSHLNGQRNVKSFEGFVRNITMGHNGHHMLLVQHGERLYDTPANEVTVIDA